MAYVLMALENYIFSSAQYILSKYGWVSVRIVVELSAMRRVDIANNNVLKTLASYEDMRATCRLRFLHNKFVRNFIKTRNL